MALTLSVLPTMCESSKFQSSGYPVDIRKDIERDVSPFQASYLAAPTRGRLKHSTAPRKAYDTQLWATECHSDRGTQPLGVSSSGENAVPFCQLKITSSATRVTKRTAAPRSQARASGRMSSSRFSVTSLHPPVSQSVIGQGEEWQTQFFKTKLCPYHLEGRCINGPACRFAHNPTELRPLPDLHKTKLCESYVRKEPCKSARCPFAHNPCELRTSSYSFYKVTLCNFYKRGRCWNGLHCRFAHGTAELQAASDEAGSQTSEDQYPKAQFQGDAQKRESSTSNACSVESEASLHGANSDTMLPYSDCLSDRAPAVSSLSETSASLRNHVPAADNSLDKQADNMQQIINSVAQLLRSFKLGTAQASDETGQSVLDVSMTESHKSFRVLPSLSNATFPPPWSACDDEPWTVEDDKSARINLDRLVNFVDVDDVPNGHPHGDTSQQVFQDLFDNQWRDVGDNLTSPVITPAPNRDVNVTSNLLMGSAAMTPHQTADRHASRHLATLASISVMDKREALNRLNHTAIF